MHVPRHAHSSAATAAVTVLRRRSNEFRPTSDAGPLTTDADLLPASLPPTRTGNSSDAFEVLPVLAQVGRAESAGVGGAPAVEVEIAEHQVAQALGHSFADPSLLSMALTHPSWRHERADVAADNQRLEFLGDLVLALSVGEILLTSLPGRPEGELSVLKSQLVREATLSEVAIRLRLGPALRLGRGLEQSGGRQRPAILADAVEALVGAVFLDAGYPRARGVVQAVLSPELQSLIAATHKAKERLSGAARVSSALHLLTRNFKTALQEELAGLHAGPAEYTLVCELGSGESRRFRVQVAARVRDVWLRAHGEGPTLRRAENAAAERLFAMLEGTIPEGCSVTGSHPVDRAKLAQQDDAP